MTKDSQIVAKLKSLRATIDNLNLRERLLIFATVLMLTGSVWYLLLMQPLAQQAAINRSQIESSRARIKTSNQNLEDQVLQITGTGTRHRERFAQIQRRIDDINEKLGDYAAELIDPAEMAQVLEGVLKRQSKLKLIRIRNLAPEVMSAATDTKTTTFYKHGLEIEFEGSYFACLEYLREIEALPWRFYWQVLELDVEKYPRNRIRVEVSTLSLDEEWIGA